LLSATGGPPPGQLAGPKLAESAHPPPTHPFPAGQALPQPPQLALSDCMSTQVPLQALRPVRHDEAHPPAEHTCPEGQVTPQAPQLPGVLVTTHPPPQEIW
jgi:hypothetical protein